MGKTDNWDDYTSNFLKSSHVKDENDAFVCTGVEDYDKGASPVPRLTLSHGEDAEFTFDLNRTNATYCKDVAKITSPKKLIGKKIYFKKVMARNPKTNIEVESLRICKIE
jgi:hypothetical protein